MKPVYDQSASSESFSNSEQDHQTESFVEGSLSVQLALLGLLVLGLLLLFYLSSYIDQILTQVQLLSMQQPDLAFQVAGRLLLWLVVFSGAMAIVIGIYLWSLAAKTRASGRYPPPALPVAFTTRIKRGAAASRMAQGCRLLALLMFLQPLLGLLGWYWFIG